MMNKPYCLSPICGPPLHAMPHHRPRSGRSPAGPLSLLVPVAVLLLFVPGAVGQTEAPPPVLEPSREFVESATAENLSVEETDNGAVESASPVYSGPEGLRLNFRGVPLDTVLDYLSREAGFVIVRDVEVEGRVDVWSHQPLSKDEVVNLLNTVLNEKGYAAVRNGRTLLIISREDARSRSIPVKAGGDPEQIPKTDEMVTQIIPIRYANAVQLIDNLELLLPSYATLSANESCNAIVLTDTQANIRRIAEIVRALDTSIANISVVKVFRLQFADAKELAEVVNEIFE